MSTDRWMDKGDVGCVYTHTMEYYSAIKENETPICSNIDAPTESKNVPFPIQRSLFLMTQTGSFERVLVKTFHHVSLPLAHISEHSRFSLCSPDSSRRQEQRSFTLGVISSKWDKGLQLQMVLLKISSDLFPKINRSFVVFT